MKRLFPALIGFLAAILPIPANALSIPINFCGIGGFGCRNVSGVSGLTGYFGGIFVNGLGVTFVAVAIAMFFYYAAQLIAGSNEESTVTESKMAYAHAITGGAIVSLAGTIVRAFTPGVIGPGGALVNRAPLEAGFWNVIDYFRLIIGTALIVNTVYQGIRLIMAQGDEDIQAVRKRLLYGFVGVAIVLLANALVIAAYPQTIPASPILGLNGQGGDPLTIVDELVGLANFFLTFLGVLAVVLIVAAGIMLIVSIDEGLKDKAKTVVKTSIITLAVVLCSYVIVNMFITFPA